MLAYCVTKALQKGTHKDIRTLLKERLMDPMGIPAEEWQCGYGQTFVVDGLPLVGTWGGGYSVRVTAAVSARWDIGPGELGCFPTKWMSTDGKTMYLVCSSDDQFTVRSLRLTTRP